jgi:excisionase family DNA binding protein
MDAESTSAPDMSPLMSVSAARAHLGGVSRETLYRLVREGELSIVKVRRRTFIPRADIEALIDRSTRGRA